MRKVTKRLLTVGVAVLVLGACQDSITVVPPPPPPPPVPPPPPPMVDATVTIQGLRAIPANTPVNPTAVAGDINVVLNVEEGTNTITDVDLTVNGDPIGCQSISTNEVPGEGVSLSEAGADVVECFFNTDDVVGSCVGEQLDPAFPNGTHTLGARITLSDATTRDASNEQQITLVNGDFLMLVHNQGSMAVVSGGVTYFGGPADPDGDGTDDNLNSFAVCPVSYQGTTVASLGLQGIAPFGNSIDLGAGSGATETDASAPFVFDLDPTDNDLASGNPVEDDVTTNGILAGHTISTAGSILDDNGINVTAQFAGAALSPVFLDFWAPQPNDSGTRAAPVAAASEVTVGGASVAPPVWYSSGALGLTNVVEGGVGWSFGSGAQVDVGDCAVPDNNDDGTVAGTGGDPATAFVPVVSDASDIADHTEDDWENGGDGFGAADAGGVDCYLAELQALADDLMNAFDLTALAATIQNVTADVEPDTDFDSYGVDITAAGISNANPDPTVQPYVLNPDNENDGVLDTVDDFLLFFDGADVALASGDPGSGVDETGCVVVMGCTAVVADVNSGPASAPATVPIGNNGTLSTDKGGADDDFLVDIGNSIAMLADGTYEIEVTVDDLASPANSSTLVYMFDLDNTPPAIGALNPAPVGSTGTDASSIVMSIGETITDAHIIEDVTLTVGVDGTDATGTGSTGACTPGSIYTLSVSAGEIDRNTLSLENGTNSVDFSGAAAEAFTIPDPFGPATATTTVRYCFVIDAEDEAIDVTGADAPNVSQLVTEVLVTWNANP